ncbi:MAG: hypothetical protein OEZ36_02925 [Spirochaetota bacterium]|nr:hypothetical protein [Spirochaetota bacterium]
MKDLSKWQKITLFLSLAAVMVALRGKHLPGAEFLPDPSLSLFFLAGMLLMTNILSFTALFLLGFAVDLFAFSNGVNSSCFTLAYWFMLPTYAVMWYGGQYFRRIADGKWFSLIQLTFILTVSGLLAFNISTGSFYLLSGHFQNLSLSQYWEGLIAYLPNYMLTIYMYMGVALAVYAISRLIARFRQPVFQGQQY